MFSKLSLFALIAPLVSGLVLQIPEKPTSGGEITIHWTNQQGDPGTWSFELINTAFNNAFAIANNVDPSTSSITLTLPIVPVGDGYTLQAVNIGNISDVFAFTGDFAVGATTTTSTTAVSTTSSTGTGTGTKSTTASITGTTPSVTPGFSSVINSATTPSATTTTINPATTANGAATTPTSAALSTRFSLGFAAILVPAMAGAMFA